MLPAWKKVSLRELANRFATIFNKPALLRGVEAESAWIFDVSCSYELFGPPQVTLEEMIEATAEWVRHAGPSLGKPTHFEVRDGNF